MNTKIEKTIIAGIIATAGMTLFMFIAPMMGMPEMNPADMLSGMMGVSIATGWIIHFMVGIIFAAAYVFFLNDLVNIPRKVLKGALFGIAVFIFAQIGITIMSLIFGEMAESEGSMILMMLASVLGHVVYGVIVALMVIKE